MINKKLKVSISLIVGILLLGVFATVAFASGTAYSNWYNYGPLNGYSYKNQSIVKSINHTPTDPGTLEAGATVSNRQNVSVPTGYMGAQAWLYDNNTGALVSSGGWLYNGAPTPSFTQWTSNCNWATSGHNYYGSGWTKAWSGSSYWIYQTNNTPIVLFW